MMRKHLKRTCMSIPDGRILEIDLLHEHLSLYRIIMIDRFVLLQNRFVNSNLNLGVCLGIQLLLKL